jgi:hypothetical protein
MKEIGASPTTRHPLAADVVLQTARLAARNADET